MGSEVIALFGCIHSEKTDHEVLLQMMFYIIGKQ